MEDRFERDYAALEDVFRFVGRFLDKNQIGADISYSINLAVEELFTNMVKYNSRAANQISIRIFTEGDKLFVTLTDVDVDPFDPSSVESVATDEPIERRTPGGLGLHLVKSVVDKISYEYRDRRMTVTVSKNLERSHV